MERDSRVFLSDVRDSAEAILRFTSNRTQEDYFEDRMLRSATEREFEIIGEALNRLSKIDPVIASRITELPDIIAFRNLLIHGYATVDDAIVWRTAKEDLPRLFDQVSELLGELGHKR